MRKNWLCVICMVFSLCCFCGCEQTPEQSIIKEKDFDKMIAAAKQTDDVTEDETTVEYDTYTTSIENQNLNVEVTANIAKVDIPQVEKMSILRVKKKEITQEILDCMLQTAMPETVLYDGAVTTLKRKFEIRREIEENEKLIDECRERLANDKHYAEVVGEQDIQYALSEIQRLEEEHKKAMDVIPWEQYCSNGKLVNVRELENRLEENSYFEYQYKLNKEGSYFFAVNDGTNGDYMSLYAQNNDAYSNCIRFHKSKNGYITNSTVRVEEQSSSLAIWNVNETPKFNSIGMSLNDLIEYTDEPTTITETQAEQTALEFIQKAGIHGYGLYQSELCYEYPYIKYFPTEEQKYGYRKVYVLTYLRDIEGVLVNNIGNEKFSDSWNGEYYSKQMWPGESLVLYVNDSGVVGMEWNAPLDVTEVIVEQSNLKTFDEIKDIFEEMVVVANAQEDSKREIEVQQVTLGYTRISEKNNFDSGVLVPVWDFRGTVKTTRGIDQSTQVESDKSILTINAIDGTVIDRELGY